MTQYFITGIGTGVGKTFCTAALLRQAEDYRAIKPVLTGFGVAEDSDAAVLLDAMNRSLSAESLGAISPLRFALPASPHLAAAAENKPISPDDLIAFCREQMALHPKLLIEGVGGLMVPLTPDWLVLDWMRALNQPVILVAGSYLGAINHTLMSLRILAQSGLRLHALIVSQSAPEADAGLDATADSILPFLPESALLVRLPRQSSWKVAPKLLSL